MFDEKGCTGCTGLHGKGLCNPCNHENIEVFGGLHGLHGSFRAMCRATPKKVQWKQGCTVARQNPHTLVGVNRPRATVRFPPQMSGCGARAQIFWGVV